MDKKGFTLTELVFVATISLMVVIAVGGAWVFTHKIWVSGSKKSELRVDVLKALEVMKNDVRLSSLTYMEFYPRDAAVYTAVSMPVAEADANGMFTLDANKNIVWDKTVIYHVFTETDGSRTLRRTVLDPRDNGLSDTERYEELEGVVTSGSGGAGSVTDADFLENLDLFEISSLAPIVDFYADSETPVKVGKVVFGWVKMSPGEHTIRFEVTGRNSASSGYGIGIDRVMIEPSGSAREMEYYSSAFAPVGALTSSGGGVTRVHDTIWDNCNYLEFGAGAPEDYIEVKDQYDLWRESSFADSSLNYAELGEEEVRAIMQSPEEDETGHSTWFSSAETGDLMQEGRDGVLPASGPIVLRAPVTSANINEDGDLIKVAFRAPSTGSFSIDRAYITRRSGSSGPNGLANSSPSGLEPYEYHRHQQLFFKDGSGNIAEGITISRGAMAWSVWTAFPIRKENDYLISIYISDPSASAARCWQGAGTKSYYLAGSEYSTMAGNPDWSGATPVVSPDIYVAAKIDTVKTAGTVESQIFDTTIADPAYNEIKWSESRPGGTDVLMKARSSDDKYMTGATTWDLITGSNVNPHTLSIGTGRYVQFFAELYASIFWKAGATERTYEEYIDEQRTLPVQDFPKSGGEYLVTGVYSTWIDDVTIDWPGSERICTITGYVAKKEDYGQATVFVDGKELSRILSIKVRAAKDMLGRREESENMIEVEPRNTGK